MTTPIRVFIADDHPLVRDGMRALFHTDPAVSLVGEADNGETALAGIAATGPDVALIDLHMPRKGGVEVIGELRQRFPALRILVVTSFDDDEHVFSAIKAGAHGYLLKDTTPQELLRAVRAVYAGDMPVHPNIAARLIQELRKPPRRPLTEDPLTPREVEILRYVSQGLTNQEIADLLVVSERTVRTHVSHVLEKLHLANRTQAALYALREGISSLDPKE